MSSETQSTKNGRKSITFNSSSRFICDHMACGDQSSPNGGKIVDQSIYYNKSALCDAVNIIFNLNENTHLTYSDIQWSQVCGN